MRNSLSDHLLNFISFTRSGRQPSVRQSLLGWLGLMWLLTLLISATTAGYTTYTTERMLWQARLREELSNSSHSMLDFVARGQMLMRMVGTFDNEVLAAQPQLMEQAMTVDPAILELIKIDAAGNVVAAVNQDRRILADTFTLAQAQWFRAARDGEDYYSNVQYSYQDMPYLILTVQAADSGVVAARLRMDVLQDVVGQLDIGETGFVYIADETGNIMAHADQDLLKNNVRDIPAFDALLRSDVRTWEGEYTNLGGQAVLGATMPISQTNWLLVTEVGQGEAYGPSRTATLFSSAIILLLALAVMIANGGFLSRLIFGPLERLRAGAGRLEQGDYAYRLQHGRRDELGLVTDAFNALAVALQTRDADIHAKTAALSAEVHEHERTQAALEELNSTLEQRIAERTARLEAMTNELQRSNKSLEEFAYVASHDLQEPLRKVRTFGDRLLERYSGVLDERGRDYLERMQNGAGRMQVLIDDLLTYSRVTTKAQPHAPVNLDEVVRSVLSDLEVRIESLHADVQARPLATIQGDALQLQQLLQNLIANALKFHRPGIPPQVCITGGWREDGAEYELAVADNGIGFDMQYAERIFQVFQRLHGRSEYEGTGVGLAICRKIVERHGGTISAASSPGEGAVFTVRLPRG